MQQSQATSGMNGTGAHAGPPPQEPGSARAPADPNRWKPGKYKAKAVDWNCSKTKEGLPQAVVLFDYQQPGPSPGTTEARQLMWFGSFKGGALERTLETLAMLGLRQPPYPAMEKGRDGKALDENIEVEIVVEHRLNNQTGQLRAGISWVNNIGGRALESKLAEGEGTVVFAEANTAFEAYLAREGITAAKPTLAQEIANKTPGTLSEDDIPF